MDQQPGGVDVRKGIEDMERELREAGHDVDREYVFDGQDSHDGAGWTVRVDGETVASGASLGALEDTLRGWMARGRSIG